jgi:hypothetical protein
LNLLFSVVSRAGSAQNREIMKTFTSLAWSIFGVILMMSTRAQAEPFAGPLAPAAATAPTTLTPGPAAPLPPSANGLNEALPNEHWQNLTGTPGAPADASASTATGTETAAHRSAKSKKAKKTAVKAKIQKAKIARAKKVRATKRARLAKQRQTKARKHS